MGDDGPRRIGHLEGPLHPPVEHGLVPRRQLLAGEQLHRCLAERRGPIEVGRHRFVVGTPDRDRWMVAQLVNGLAGLANGLLANRTGVAPLQREVLPQQHAELVGRLVQLRAGDVTVHSE